MLGSSAVVFSQLVFVNIPQAVLHKRRLTVQVIDIALKDFFYKSFATKSAHLPE